MKKINKIQLTEEKETLLITLYAKALDSRSKQSILHDTAANDLVNEIDYDFTKFKNFFNDNLVVVRARQYDDWIEKFINENSNAVIIHLGCGLDTRVSRISRSSLVTWFDIDYPEVIELRKSFYSDGENYKMVAADITDPGWLEKLPQNRPTLIIAEGVLEYLYPDDAKRLLNRLVDYFDHGELMFDVMSSFAVQAASKNIKEATGAVHRWAVDDISEVDSLDEKLKRISYVKLFNIKYVRELPFKFRILFRLFSHVPKFKDMMRLVLYQF